MTPTFFCRHIWPAMLNFVVSLQILEFLKLLIVLSSNGLAVVVQLLCESREWRYMWKYWWTNSQFPSSLSGWNKWDSLCFCQVYEALYMMKTFFKILVEYLYQESAHWITWRLSRGFSTILSLWWYLIYGFLEGSTSCICLAFHLKWFGNFQSQLKLTHPSVIFI